MNDLIEYKVRPVTRYVVTKFERSADGASSSQRGEFDNHETAYAVGYALAKADHERMGWPIGDERIQYPSPVWLEIDGQHGGLSEVTPCVP